jgi:hypothetical protein
MNAEKIDPEMSNIRDILAHASIVHSEDDFDYESSADMKSAWLSYIREMAPFYSDLIGHYFKVVSN